MYTGYPYTHTYVHEYKQTNKTTYTYLDIWLWGNQIPHAGDRPPPPTPQLDRTRTLLPNRLESPSTHKLETAVSQAASGTLTEMAESPSTNERTPGPKQMRVATLADIAQTQMPMETTHFLPLGLAWAWLC